MAKDGKTPKKKKHHPSPPSSEREDHDTARGKKRQKLHDSPAAASAERDENAEKRTAKQGKEGNQNKKMKNRENREINGEESKGKKHKKKGGGGGALVTDDRFSQVHYDPRFQNMPRKESKVPIDSRFASMLTDPKFGDSSAPVDKRGRPRKGKSVNPLLGYYLHENDEIEKKLRRGSDSEAESLDEEEDLSGPGSDFSDASSDTEDEDDDEDQFSVNSDIAKYLMANHDDTPTTEQETHRLAVVNMDWEHVRAVDIFVVMNSCVPKGGEISSVAVYPSEFGLKCMEVEAVRGPSGLVEDNEEDSEDDQEVDNEKCRTYELNKLRYYYAVVGCDSSATANHIYKTLDGTELLKTSNVFDLRFIPDSMEFNHPPRDITTEAPTSYKEPDFETRALQHSKVRLTWEDDDPNRKMILRRKFNPDQLDIFNQYLASSEESDDGDDDENVTEAGDAEKDGLNERKKHLKREKLLSLLQPEDKSDADDDDDKDMEVTFNTGLEDLSKHILEKKDKKPQTVWEAALKRRSEKKKARKNRSKYSSSDDDSDFEVQEAPDQPDDFFAEDPFDSDAKPGGASIKSKSRNTVKSSRKGKEQPPDIKEQEASKEELELLFADDLVEDDAPKGYNFKGKKHKGKRGKEVPVENKLPNVDFKDDPRFSSLFSSHLFALDPTDPQYKRSAAYARQQSQKHGTGASEAPVKGAADPSQETKPVDLVQNKDDSRPPTVEHEFSSTIRSLKRNLVTTAKKDSKSR